MEKCPVASVVTPPLEPFTCTEVPERSAAPAPRVTIPETVTVVCEKATVRKKTKKQLRRDIRKNVLLKNIVRFPEMFNVCPSDNEPLVRLVLRSPETSGF